jgi:hypothetical protein
MHVVQVLQVVQVQVQVQVQQQLQVLPYVAVHHAELSMIRALPSM